METQNVNSIIISIVSQIIQCEPSVINEESGLIKTFGWDSLAQVRIISKIEEEFKINIPDNRIIELSTIAKLIEYLICQ